MAVPISTIRRDRTGGGGMVPLPRGSRLLPFTLLDMKLLAQSHTRVLHPASVLEWKRWFAWYPVPVVNDGKLHHAWLQTVERKWGTSRYSGTIKWRYRLPPRSRSR
jgi:hypothetical protein